MSGRCVLVSYERPEQIQIAAEICPSVILDNGVFHAWKHGKRYDFAGYREWAGKWLRHPSVDWCVIPDVIDGEEAVNDALLVDWDLPIARSVPVYHMHESLHRLERLVLTYPRIAIGSSGQFASPRTRAWWSRMTEIMRVACDKDGMPRTKLHGLRQLAPGIISRIPYASADASTAAQAIVYDKRWVGPYSPASKEVRAIVVMDRIDRHPTAASWDAQSLSIQQNMDFLA